MPVTDGAAAPRMRRLATVALIAALVLAASALASAWAQIGPLGGPRPPPADGVIGWLFAQQALFYRALAGMIRAAKTDGSAYWGLIGISFLYGIFHAAGPGHGKAVISSYLLANEETWRRGIALVLRLGAAPSPHRHRPCRRRRAPHRRDREDDGRHRARHRDRQLCADRALGRAAVLGEGARLSCTRCTPCASASANAHGERPRAFARWARA